MKIGIISDIHDNYHNLILFLKQIEKLDIEKIIFLGDFMNNGIAKILASSYIPSIAIWGNNDGDKVAITKTSMSKNSNLSIGFDTYDFLEIDNKKIFISHYPVLAKHIAKSGDFDAVFYGHDHIKNIEHIADCIIVNPGEISAHKTGTATFAIYDTKTNDAKILELNETISTKTKEAKEHIKKFKKDFS